MITFLKNLSIITFLLCLLPNLANAQDCGTQLLPEQVKYMNNTRIDRNYMNITWMNINLFDSADVGINLPIAAHIIRDKSGNEGLSIIDLQTAIDDLNNIYTQVNFTFHLCSINYIDNDKYANYEMSFGYDENTSEYKMAVPNLVANAINVFFLPKTKGCGWSSFPSYLDAFGKDWLVIENKCATNESTLAHEIGHYFNLYHTHQGTSSGLNIVGSELVNRSNCGPNVGDELCDTPADPNISGGVNEICKYTNQLRDSNNDLYVPDPSNVMSYSKKHCRTKFSPKQIDRIQRSYMYDRNNLNETVCASICEDESACNFGEPETCSYGNVNSLCTDPCNCTLELKEDCVSFNPNTISILPDNRIVDGNHAMMSFPNYAEAKKAYKIIKQYGVNQHCFVGRPYPSFTYLLKNGSSPVGVFSDEDCIGFDPDNLYLVREGSEYLMTDGYSRKFMFPNKAEAEATLAIIKKHGFTKTCYVGRPYASLQYMRKDGINYNIGPFINVGINPLINYGLGSIINPGIGGPKLGDAESTTISTNSFAIFPNPTNGKVTISLDQNSTVPHTLTIFELSGKIIHQNTFTGTSTNLDLSNIAKGMYMIKIQNNQTKDTLSIQKLLVK